MNMAATDIDVLARDLRRAARRINELVSRKDLDGVQFVYLYDAAQNAFGAAAALDALAAPAPYAGQDRR